MKKIILYLLLFTLTLSLALAATRTFYFQETDFVKIKAEAADPDYDQIKYTFSPPLDEKGEWQTNYGDAGEYLVEITASDGTQATTEKVKLVIEEKNQPPVLKKKKIMVKEGQLIDLTKLAQDPNGDPLTYVFAEPFDQEGKWQTTAEDIGTVVTEFKINDGKVEVHARMSVEIISASRLPQVADKFPTGKNLDPEFSPFLIIPPDLEAREGELFTWKIDTSKPAGKDLAVSLDGAPEKSWLDQENLTFYWLPSFDEIKRTEGIIGDVLNFLRLEHHFLKTKKITFGLEVCNDNQCAEEKVSLILHNVNRKPELSLDNLIIKETEEIKLEPKAVDHDGDVISYYFTEPLSKTGGNWRTERGDQGNYTVYITATDGKEGTTIPMQIEVLKDNRAPIIKIKDDDLTVNEGQQFLIRVEAKDPDDDDLDLYLNNPPAGATFSDGIFLWEPGYNSVAEQEKKWRNKIIGKISVLNKKLSQNKETVWLEFTANDGKINTVHPVKVTIKDVNKRPEIVDFLPEKEIAVNVGEPVVFHVAAKDEDSNVLDYTWSFSFHESWVKGTNTIERTFVQPGTKKVKVVVSDGEDKIAKIWKINVAEKKPNVIIPPGRIRQDFSRDEFSMKVYVVEG